MSDRRDSVGPNGSTRRMPKQRMEGARSYLYPVVFVVAAILSLAFREPFGWPWIVAGSLLVVILLGYRRIWRGKSVAKDG